jgi:hypothetical protein
VKQNIFIKVSFLVFFIFFHFSLSGVEIDFEIPEDEEAIVGSDDESDEDKGFDKPKKVETKDEVSTEAKNSDHQDETALLEESVTLQYEEKPEHIYKNQIFRIKIKTVLASGEYEKIKYKLFESRGLHLINEKPERIEEEHYVFDTFYFKALESKIVTPSIYVYIRGDEAKGYKTFIKGESTSAIELIPPENFSQVLAENLELLDYKTTRYDQENNILIFSLNGYFGDLKLFNIKDFNIKRQGFESVKLTNNTLLKSSITYFVIIPKYLTQFSFSYFNILSETYKEISVPIIVSDDIVSTQTDLAPKEKNHNNLKIIVSSLIVLLLLFLFWFYRKSLFLIISIVILPYLVFLILPPKEICVKKHTLIRILPMIKSTVFQQMEQKSEFEKLGKVGEFIKVKLPNNNIGWVKEDDLCKK